ncbi:MAG: peptide deformylase [Capsulimonadaceae bacterium]|nr:peptide deformylase [Capsulimonadaceae bacterium]
MPARDIISYPDPRLKTVCEAVVDPCVAQLVAADLLATLDICPPRTVGIAAPQIGDLVRVVVVDSSRNPKFEGGHGLLSLVNPRIVSHEGSMVFREGCLSLPDYTANIRRFERVTVHALDLDLREVEVDASGFEAVVLQHELDHLDGVLFLDRVADIKTDLFPRKRK